MVRRVIVIAAVVTLIIVGVRFAPTPPPSSAVVGAMGRGPTIVLVHGLGSDYDDWLPTARDLARDHRVVLVELPGHGITPMAAPFTLEQASLALDRAIAEESPHAPVVLVGHSIGGLVAAFEAKRAPQRVRELVLVETALAPQSSKAETDTLFAMLDHDLSGTLRTIYHSFGRDSVQSEMLWREALQLRHDDMRQWIRVAVSADLSKEAAGLTMPVLAVLSARSWEPGETWTHAATALGYASMPHLKGVRFDDCGHFLMLDAPERLASTIRRFCAPTDSVFALR